jgi:hypothetical protein
MKAPRNPTGCGGAVTSEDPVYRLLEWAIPALVLCGCAGRAEPGFSYQSDVLTGDQLARTRAGSVYEAVLRLRPAFLHARGPSSVLIPGSAGPALWVDQSHVGDVRELRDMPIGDVVSIRLLRGWEAVTRYGSRFSNGVLVVATRP